MAARLNDSDDDLAENHEINVTPFIDVMLVLLIIFMVAAPLSTVDVPVDLLEHRLHQLAIRTPLCPKFDKHRSFVHDTIIGFIRQNFYTHRKSPLFAFRI